MSLRRSIHIEFEYDALHCTCLLPWNIPRDVFQPKCRVAWLVYIHDPGGIRTVSRAKPQSQHTNPLQHSEHWSLEVLWQRGKAHILCTDYFGGDIIIVRMHQRCSDFVVDVVVQPTQIYSFIHISDNINWQHITRFNISFGFFVLLQQYYPEIKWRSPFHLYTTNSTTGDFGDRSEMIHKRKGTSRNGNNVLTYSGMSANH